VDRDDQSRPVAAHGIRNGAVVRRMEAGDALASAATLPSTAYPSLT